MKSPVISREKTTKRLPRLLRVFAALLLLGGACAGPGPSTATDSSGVRQGPLNNADIMAFIATNDAAKSRAFYVDTLGLRFIEEDGFALVLESAGTRIRVQKAKDYEPPPFTVLGWRVRDIEASAARLSMAGVKLERFEWMSMQDDHCIATFGNGDKVAWFMDPDGNTLSIAQLVQ
jgi:catechol 2,3-dioxygenase-like lactoylglutathione lyase family enzyme